MFYIWNLFFRNSFLFLTNGIAQCTLPLHVNISARKKYSQYHTSTQHYSLMLLCYYTCTSFLCYLTTHIILLSLQCWWVLVIVVVVLVILLIVLIL